MDKPKDISEYPKWLKDNLNVTIEEHYKNYFNLITSTLKENIQNSNFFVSLIKNLREYNDEYEMQTGFPLLNYNQKIEFDKKSYNSFLLKSFRRNIIDNDNFPNAPNKGWLVPENWFENVNDIIRTTISVKYLDGVEFLMKKMTALAEENGFISKYNLEAKEEGYYAAHSYFKKEIDIPGYSHNPIKIKFEFEIQITTQLQEVIKTLLHKHYEVNRKKEKNPNSQWQWDYQSLEFSTNYLGHILHYVEGMIMDVRTKQDKNKTI